MAVGAGGVVGTTIGEVGVGCPGVTTLFRSPETVPKFEYSFSSGIGS